MMIVLGAVAYGLAGFRTGRFYWLLANALVLDWVWVCRYLKHLMAPMMYPRLSTWLYPVYPPACTDTECPRGFGLHRS